VTTDPARELDALLEEVAFELTQARAAALAHPESLRHALKRARELIAQADALVSSVAATQRAEN
jgi:hypothetical protein